MKGTLLEKYENDLYIVRIDKTVKNYKKENISILRQ